MKYKLLTITLALFFTLPVELLSQGHLVIIGGGPRPDYVMDKFIDLAGGKDSRIIIFPTASYDPLDAGEFYVKEFTERGVENVDYIICTRETADTEENFELLKGATGVFFSGGDQNRHTAALLGTQLIDKVKHIYDEGGAIGGTSAGAAIMSEVMITGDEYLADEDDEPFSMIKGGNIVTAEGLGFLDRVIIDQHFVERKRHNRLMSLVLEYPGLVGLGIGEATALVVDPEKTFQVLGEGTVVVYDARKSTQIDVDRNRNLSARNITVHILQSEEKYTLDN